jgi:glycosyltransferase involved in cell wall biosynthesis
MTPLHNSLALLCPVYNDWQSLAVLISHLDSVLEGSALRVSLFVVDDGSTVELDSAIIPQVKNIQSIECLSLLTNLGHQRAIAVGLCEIEKRNSFNAVIIMDSDGEDRPEDILSLLKAHEEKPKAIVVAQRVARSEGKSFKFFYFFYKNLFQFLTGQAIDFGNYCLIPASQLRHINAMTETWNHLAASIVRSRIPLIRVPTSRAKRYAGTSSMNFIALVLHGFGGMSVFIDVFLVRLLMILLGLGALGLITALAILIIKLGNPQWDPSWLNFMLGFGCVLLTQIIAFALVTIFIVLSQRGTQKLPPSIFATSYLKDRIILKD